MGKDKHKGPHFLVPIPYVPEEEKEADPRDGKPPSVKLLLDSRQKYILSNCTSAAYIQWGDHRTIL
jgi:hypothetical protein